MEKILGIDFHQMQIFSFRNSEELLETRGQQISLEYLKECPNIGLNAPSIPLKRSNWHACHQRSIL